MSTIVVYIYRKVGEIQPTRTTQRIRYFYKANIIHETDPRERMFLCSAAKQDLQNAQDFKIVQRVSAFYLLEEKIELDQLVAIFVIPENANQP
jgi:hypothetical protein